MTEPSILSSLREDHTNARRLLDILMREAQLIRDGDDADYEVIEGITDYFKGYPDACHHPIEDRMFQRMVVVDAARVKAVGDLLVEHGQLRRKLADVVAALRDVRLEAEVPRNNIVSRLESFVDAYRRHMDAEDRQFFPLAAAMLDDDGWAAVGSAAASVGDPLFAAKEGFDGLRKRMLAFEKDI